jgi:eukaryotic-like serine/threonine-protein kinase
MKTVLYSILCGIVLAFSQNVLCADESIVWNYQTNGRVYATPVIEDSIMYIGSLDSNLYAINVNTGEKIWSYHTSNEIRTTVAIFDSILCFAAGQKLLGLSKSGDLIWEFLLYSGTFSNNHDDWDDFNSSPLIVDTVAYIGTEAGLVFGVNVISGDTVLHFQTPGATHTIETTLVYHEGKIYFGDWNGVFYCVDVQTAELVWSYDTKVDGTFSWVNAILTRSVIYADQVLFAGRCSRLYSLNLETGSKTWMTVDAGGLWMMGGLVLEDTIVYAGSSNQFVFQAFNVKTGAYLWRAPVDNRIYGCPFIGEDYYIVGTGLEPTDANGSLYLLNKSDHQIRERIRFGGQVHSSPVMVDSMIYVGCADGNVYAVSLSAMLNKLRPHTYLENTSPVDLGEIPNTEAYSTYIELLNDGEALDSIVVTCQNDNVQIEPSTFLIDAGGSQTVSLLFNTPLMEPKFYTINVVFKSWRSLLEDRIVKKYNMEVIGATSIEGYSQSENLMLGQNYPNPFTGRTVIPIQMARGGYVKLLIGDLTGNSIAVLYEGYLEEGAQTIIFDKDFIHPGLYTCQIITDDVNETIIMQSLVK